MKAGIQYLSLRMALVATFVVFSFGLTISPGIAESAEDTIVVAHEAAVPNLDPAQILGLHSVRVIRLIFEALVTTKTDVPEVIPHLAKSWSVSPDGLEWTFKLRENVKFHDGEPFNADAVKYSIDRYLNPKHPDYKCGKWSFVRGYARPIKEVVVVDPLTVKLVLKNKHAAFAGYLANQNFGMVSPKAHKRLCEDFSSKPVGTGPYKLDNWQRGVKLTLVRNDNYWGTKGKPKRIIFRPIAEEQTRVAELLAGSVDVIIPVFPDSIGQIEKNKNTRILKTPGLTDWYVVLNNDKKPFNDVRVRQAVNYAVNKKAIVHDILKDTGDVSTQLSHPTSWGYNPNVKMYSYDLAKAKKLLAEAGYPNGFSVNFWVPESGSGMQLPKEMAQVIQANLGAVGIKVKMETFEWGTYLSKVRENDRTFDMAALSWFLKVSDPDLTLYPMVHSKSVPFVNYMQYNNPEVDRLLVAGREEFDKEKRKKIYHKINEIVNNDAPVIFIDHQKEVLGVRANVKGVTMNPNGWLLGVESAYHE